MRILRSAAIVLALFTVTGAARGAVDSITVAGREIRVRTLERWEGDGRCCPSGRGGVALRVEDRRLVRVPVRGW